MKCNMHLAQCAAGGKAERKAAAEVLDLTPILTLIRSLTRILIPTLKLTLILALTLTLTLIGGACRPDPRVGGRKTEGLGSN